MTRAGLGWLVLLAACSRGAAQEKAVQEKEEPRGELARTRSVLARLDTVGDVSDLRLDGEDLLVAGTCGVARVDPQSGEVLESHRYALPCPPFLDGRIVDLDADGTLEILRFSEGWVGPTAVLRLDGTVLWKSELPGRCDRPLVRDETGRLGVLVGAPNQDTVFLLDETGRHVWKQDWGPSQAGVVSLVGRGEPSEAYAYADGDAIHVTDGRGERLRTVEVPGGRDGYVNALEETTQGVVVGVYHGEQRWYAYSWMLQPLGDAGWEGPLRDAPFSRVIRLEGRDVLLRFVNEKDQAAVVGFDGGRLRVQVLRPPGVTLMEDVVDTGELARTCRVGVVVTGEEPLGFVVGYGNTVYRYGR